ncbi:MAG: bifunctional diaminohydroxyphosphoribosylaminopyrimidine deaminase/5-amino-6-(5-phosphoribosylamino)uracil reductase RibD [Micromonosporaceae bacterium]|nr:bifunctional diaminohydroxyphosphoribosylaminopyrimidine deaminase/5-amino-6-(5-phosphoribosylamino)uracil reductase RibD [Micromonosporaceae bacterium]
MVQPAEYVGATQRSAPGWSATERAAAEYAAMGRALQLAAAGLGETSPNPSVGAVILDATGRVVGEGRTAPPPGPHAEVQALAQAGERARGGTAVVTLEPCDHIGRTGPCSAALLQAGVARVVVGVPDPDPVAGGGVGTLRSAGVDVQLGVRAAEAEHGLRYWLTAVRRHRPYLIWKYASTMDGRAAAADGTSQWITSPEARHDVHLLRSTVDAIVAGVGTVLADDARLTVRAAPPKEPGLARAPLRVVVDSRGRTPATARVRDAAAPTLIATADGIGATADGRVDLAKLLATLYDRGVRGALLEGGPTLAGALLAAGAIDEVVAYLAPKLLGAGPAVLGPAGIGTLAGAAELELPEVTRVGTDVRITARVMRGDA